MDLVNNKYRVIRDIERSTLWSSFLVQELSAGNSEKVLTVVDGESAGAELLDFLTGEYALWRNFASPFILRNYDTELVHTVGGKRSEELRYCILSEFAGDGVPLGSFIGALGQTDVPELFSNACRAVYYLHLKDICYKDINLRNVFIVGEGRGYCLKLRDYASAWLYRKAKSDENADDIYFRAPEVLFEESYTPGTDIYSLGVLLFSLITINETKSRNFKTDFIAYKEMRPDCRFVPIIERATADVSARYASVTALLEDLNHIFGTVYSAFDVSEVERLHLGTDIVGRADELTAMTEHYDKTVAGSAQKRIMCIHGDQGIGKTTLLSGLKNRLYLQKADVFWTFGQRGDGALRLLLRQLVEAGGPGVGDGDFARHILAFVGGNELKEGDLNRNSIIKFVYDSIKDRPVVFVIDDFEYADEFTMSLLEKLVPVCKKLCTFIAYRNGVSDGAFLEFLERNDSQICSIEPKPLSAEDSTRLIQNALRTRTLEGEFAQALYKTTHGNPLFIEEILKNLQTNRILYARETDGGWHIDSSPQDYAKIPMPGSIEQAIKEQAGNLDESSYALLEIASIFDTYLISRGEFEMFLRNVPQERLDSLVDAGFLYCAADRLQKGYRINDKLMKGYLYESMLATKRAATIELHRTAASMLLAVKELSGHTLNTLEEAIFQLGKFEHGERLLDCLIENAKRLFDMKDYKLASVKLTRALEVSRALGERLKELRVLVELGEAYVQSYQHLLAQQTYEDAYVLAEELGMADKAAAVDVGLANCHHNLLDLAKSREHLERAAAYYETVDVGEGFTNDHQMFINFLLRNYVFTDEIDLFLAKQQWVMDNCKPHQNELKGRTIFALGYLHLSTGELDKALTELEEARDLCLQAGDMYMYATVLGNLAVCYQYMGNTPMSMAASLEIIEVSRDLYLVATAHMNYAEVLSDKILAHDHLYTALSLYKLSGNVQGVIMSHACILCNSLEWDNIAESYEHLLECDAHNPMPDDPGILVNTYATSFYHAVGDAAQVRAHAQETIQRIGENPFFDTNRATMEFLLAMEHFFEQVGGDAAQAVRMLIEKVREIAPKGGEWMIRKTYILLHKSGLLDHTLTDIEGPGAAADMSPFIEPECIYVQALAAKGSERLALLQKGLAKAKEQRQHRFIAYICEDLAAFFETGSYYRLDYLAQACESVQNIVLTVPDEFFEAFVGRHGLFAPFEKMLAERGIAPGEKIADKIKSNALFESILADDVFMASARAARLEGLPSGVGGITDAMGYMGPNSEDNMELLAKCFAAVACAPECVIILDDPEDGFVCISSSSGNKDLPPDHRYILKRAKALGCDVLATQKFNTIGDDTGALLPEYTKAAMCIPLFAAEKISGYVYIHSDRAVNEINPKTLAALKAFTPLISLNLALYTTKAASMLDKLTGGFNRKFLEISLDHHVASALQSGGVFSIIMTDLDRFKTINDVYGHQVGDTVIKGTGKVIRETLRKDTPFGRYGGEEFVVILDNIGPEGAYEVAEKLRLAIEGARLLGAKRAVTGSMGVATFGVHDNTKTGLIEKADKALYLCKQNGRNRTEIYDPARESTAKIQNTTLGIISGDVIMDNLRTRATLSILDNAKSTPCPTKRKEFLTAKLKELLPPDKAADADLEACIRNLTNLVAAT